MTGPSVRAFPFLDIKITKTKLFAGHQFRALTCKEEVCLLVSWGGPQTLLKGVGRNYQYKLKPYNNYSSLID
jgi:hypothetical protein